MFVEELSGIFVKSISEGSAADLCKKIQVNDRIVEVRKAYIRILESFIFMLSVSPIFTIAF
jgi:C-terminal processing protease CtpA/Prc